MIEEQADDFNFITSEEGYLSPPTSDALPASEPLFATLLRRAVAKIWPDDQVMADFVDHIAQPLSDLGGHRSVKGGNLATEMAAWGKDAARNNFDQSIRAHLTNGLFPVLHIAARLKAWGSPQFRYYDDEVRRIFMAGYILHDWLKLPDVEAELEATGFDYDDPVSLSQMPEIEVIFEHWCVQLGFASFLSASGGPAKVLHDLIFVATSPHNRWSSLHDLTLLPRLKLDSSRLNLCEQLSRLADYLACITRSPREVASHPGILEMLSALSDGQAYLTYHHLADKRGVLTNFIHSSVLNAMQSEKRVPLLYAPSGVVYLTGKDAPPFPAVGDIVETTIDRIKHRAKGQLSLSLKGFGRDGHGLKYANYYWLFFDLPSFVELGSRAVFKIINESKKPSAGKRYIKIRDEAWLPETVDLDLPDDLRVDQLAEWCYLTEKMVATQQETFDTAGFLLAEMGLSDLKADFLALPRDIRAGHVGFHWYFAAGHYLKRHSGLDPAAWRKRIEALAGKLAAALLPAVAGSAGAEVEDEWLDLRTYITEMLTIGSSLSLSSSDSQSSSTRQAFAIELQRYQNAKRKGRGGTSICSLCSSAFAVDKQRVSAILFAPMVYSNRLRLHGFDVIRNICSICGMETMLRQLFMNRSNASGGDFEGRRIRYLYFYPTYFFTPETLAVFREFYVRLGHLSFTELRKQLITGEGLGTTANLDPVTWQRLETLLLTPSKEFDPANDRYVRIHLSEQEPATFYFLGVPPPGQQAKDAEVWVHPAFLALLLPLCLDVKVVASESPLPLPIEADELPETVFFDGAHTFVGRLLGQERLNFDQLLPALQRLTVAYLIQMDANSGVGRTGFDYRWQEIPSVTRNLASSPLYAFHYLKKWQRQQGLDILPAGKAQLYLLYVENHLSERNNGLSQARQLTMLFRQFYRANRSNSTNILRPVNIAAKTILNAGEKLIDDREVLTEVVFDELRRRLIRLFENNQAFYPKGSKRTGRRKAMRRFADYLVNTVYFETLKGNSSALRGKQFNLLSSACEAIYRYESAKEWADQLEPESTEA